MENFLYFPTRKISSGKMIARIDLKGRLYLPKNIRKKLGSEVYIIEVGDTITVIPKPKDPIKELEEAGKKLPDKTIKELKNEILEEALKQL